MQLTNITLLYYCRSQLFSQTQTSHADDLSPRHAISKKSFAMTLGLRKVLVRPWVGVRVCHLLLLCVFFFASHPDPHVAHRAVFLWDEPERYSATNSRPLKFSDSPPILTNIYSPRACAQYIHKTKNQRAIFLPELSGSITKIKQSTSARIPASCGEQRYFILPSTGKFIRNSLPTTNSPLISCMHFIVPGLPYLARLD